MCNLSKINVEQALTLLSVNSDVPAKVCASQVMCQPPCPGPSSQLGDVGDVGEVGEVGEVGLVLPACLCARAGAGSLAPPGANLSSHPFWITTPGRALGSALG